MPRHQVVLDDYPIRVVRVDESLEDFAAAKAMLDCLARNAMPILRRHGWSVVRLVELSRADWECDRRFRGLCMRAGDRRTAKEIQIKLRGFPNMAFRPFDSLMDTMLHELTHIVHGDHTAQFWNLLADLKAEWNQFVSEGKVSDAQGFPTSGGQCLGGFATEDIRAKRLARFGAAPASNRQKDQHRSPGLGAVVESTKRRQDVVVQPIVAPSNSFRCSSSVAGSSAEQSKARTPLRVYVRRYVQFASTEIERSCHIGTLCAFIRLWMLCVGLWFLARPCWW